METSLQNSDGSRSGLPDEGTLRHEPFKDLVTNLSRDVGLLMRQEVALAKEEATAKVSRVKAEAAGLAVGGALVHISVLVFAAALVLGLAELMPPWIAALLSAVVLLGIGGGLLLRGKSRLADLELAPKRTLENVQRDVAAVQEAVR